MSDLLCECGEKAIVSLKPVGSDDGFCVFCAPCLVVFAERANRMLSRVVDLVEEGSDMAIAKRRVATELKAGKL